MTHTSTLVFALALSLGTAGCTSSLSSNTYSRSDARQAQELQMGTVEHLRAVRIEGTRSNIGTGAGAVVGGIAGSSVGGGKGKTLATVAGVIAGGLAGAATEELATRQDGLEITVNLDNGRTIIVVQGSDTPFQIGDRVRVITGASGLRITH